MPSTTPPMPKMERSTHDVYLSTPCIRHVAHHLDAGEDDADDHYLKQKGDSPGEKGGNEPAQQGPTAAAMAAAAPTSA